MSAFTATRRVRFAHCDPAGIAYYPRLFELLDTVIEDWTEAVLGVPRRELHLEQGLALPTVDLQASFTAPARLGETLTIALATRRVGCSSVDLEASTTLAGEPRFTVRYRQVLMDMASARSRAWPEAWRVRLEQAAGERAP